MDSHLFYFVAPLMPNALFTPRPSPNFLLSYSTFTKHFYYDYTYMKYNILHDTLCGTPGINCMQHVLYCDRRII